MQAVLNDWLGACKKSLSLYLCFHLSSWNCPLHPRQHQLSPTPGNPWYVKIPKRDFQPDLSLPFENHHQPSLNQTLSDFKQTIGKHQRSLWQSKWLLKVRTWALSPHQFIHSTKCCKIKYFQGPQLKPNWSPHLGSCFTALWGTLRCYIKDFQVWIVIKGKVFRVHGIDGLLIWNGVKRYEFWRRSTTTVFNKCRTIRELNLQTELELTKAKYQIVGIVMFVEDIWS